LEKTERAPLWVLNIRLRFKKGRGGRKEEGWQVTREGASKCRGRGRGP